MSLTGDVKTICDRLAPLGWRELLLAVTNNALDISQPTNAKLKTALTTPLTTIDRSMRGFEDFHRTANQATTCPWRIGSYAATGRVLSPPQCDCQR